MKLTAITDEISQEFEHALDVLCEYGVHGAELRGLWGTNIADLQPADVTRAKRALADRGMEVACLASPFFKCDIESEDASERGPLHLARARGLPEQMEMLRRLAGLAHDFGTPYIRVFAFWRRGPYTADLESRIIDAFAEPVRIAAEEGVTLLLENEHACYVGTGAETARVVASVNSPHLLVCWDPGNAYSAGETPYPDGYEAVRPYVRHIHVKDGVAEDDGATVRWTVIGQGRLDYDGQFAALRRDGYAGYVSLETHYVPAGGTPEDGSRPCLEALRRYIKD